MDNSVAVVKAIRISIGAQMVTLSTDEASALWRELGAALAFILNPPPAPKIGRPKGSRNLRKELIKKINAMERKDKAAAKRAAKGKSKTSAEPASMTPPAHKL